jgi:oligoendopeptidase F
MLKDKLQEISEHLEEIEVRENQAKFNFYMKTYHESIERIENERTKYYKSIVGPFLRRYKTRLSGEESDIIAMMKFLGNNYDNLLHFKQPNLMEIAEKIIQNSMNFEFSINGEKLSRAETISTLEFNNDPKMRKLAWDNFVTLGKQNRDLYFRLFSLRKKIIKKLGYPDLYKWSIMHRQLQDLDIPTYLIARVARNQLGELLHNAFNVRMSHLNPWDLKYFCLYSENNDVLKKLGSKQFNYILERVVKGSGYDLKKLNVKLYKAEIPYDGLCIGTYFKKAVILFNPRESFESLTYLFHEFGHAFHTVRQKSNYYLLAAAEPSFFYEGVAYCFEKIAINAQFIEKELDFPKNEVASILRQARLRRLYDILTTLVMVEFEKNIYLTDIHIDEIDQLYSRLYENLMGIKHPKSAYWASTVYFAREMFSALDYLLAEMIVNQSMPAIYQKSNCKDYLSIIPLLDKYYILPGGKIDWNYKIRSLTGSFLSSKLFIESIKNEKK